MHNSLSCIYNFHATHIWQTFAIPRGGSRRFDHVGYRAGIWKKMAEWGVPGALALLIVLNLGLFLRAGGASWYTHKVGRLFASSCRSSTCRSDDAGRDGSSEGAGTTATIAPATSQKRVSAANADSGVAHLRQS
jgi:hypothetical protein